MSSLLIVRCVSSSAYACMARQTRSVTRERVPFGEQRPFTYWRKKRFKRFHQTHNHAVYMPGKSSPLWPLVEEVRVIDSGVIFFFFFV